MTEDYNEKILVFDKVVSGYREQNVLRDVTFSIGKGEFVYLIGKTGAGKSSILKMIYADLQPRAGQLRVGEYNIQDIPRKSIPKLRRRLGIVFQDFQLLPDRTIIDNLYFAMKATGWKDKKRMKQRSMELLSRVGLSAKLNSMPHQLSGGEQQRVSIARALINDPILLLADEPTGNLDPVATDMIMDILFRINLAGTSVIMATHEYELIRKYPARTLECTEGVLVDRKFEISESSGQ